MKLKYLGTAAAERVPAIFCDCQVCQTARQRKGRDIRTQTQALIDDGELLIDFPGDSYLHMLQHGLNYNAIENLLITHWHSDHLYAEDLAYRMSGYGQNLPKPLHVYGNAFTQAFYDRAFELEGRHDDARIQYHAIEPYQKQGIGHYEVYPIVAYHGLLKEDCFVYGIRDKETQKALLYAHDTGVLKDKDLNYLQSQNLQFDLVSLDCTGQGLKGPGSTHMTFNGNLLLIDKLKRLNMVKKETAYIANHFSHNGGMNYDEMCKLSEANGVITAYDGMEIEV